MSAESASASLVQLTRKRGMSEATFAELIDQLGRRRAGLIETGEGPGLDAETLDESRFSAGESSPPDCLTCGACCAYFQQIAVLDSDPTPRRLAWTVWDAEAIAGPKTHWLRREPHQGCCIAFNGRVGRQSFCAIYEVRPHSCRAFAAGSDRCRAVRRLYGLEPPLSEVEQMARAQRIKADAGDELAEVEALASQNAAGLGEREKAGLLGKMIDYNGVKLAEIFREAQRLHALLAEKGVAPATNGAGQVSAIDREALAVAAALAPLPAIEGVESLSEIEVAKLNGDLLAVAAQSQAALGRASRWLLALGEVVFATFEMSGDLVERRQDMNQPSGDETDLADFQ